MYKLKKIFALVMALVLATSFSTVAFAAEESGIPENATRHTIEVTVEPGETLEGTEAGIAPYIWNQGTYNPPANGGVTYTPMMNIPQRYFAFECSALTTSGGSCNGSYSVYFVRSVTALIASTGSLSVDGSIKKIDWISIDDTSANNYQFKIINNTSNAINVTITYYSWA